MNPLYVVVDAVLASHHMWGPRAILSRTRLMGTLTRSSRRDLGAATALLGAAQGTWASLSAPSPLATGLLMACTAALGVETDTPSFSVAAIATLFGYSARLARPATTLPVDAELTIGTQLVAVRRDRHGALDPGDLGPLLGLAATLADDRDRIRRLADVPEPVWRAFCSMAVAQVRARAASDGVPARLIPSDRALETLLRFGYVLRLIDEVADDHRPRL